MKENESIFNDWLEDLPTSTFTIFESQDEIDELLCHAKYSKLKELMIEKTEQYLKENKPDKQTKELFRQKYQGSRYSFGYPACPELKDQELIFKLLDANSEGLELTEEYQIVPPYQTI